MTIDEFKQVLDSMIVECTSRTYDRGIREMLSARRDALIEVRVMLQKVQEADVQSKETATCTQ